MTPEEYERFKEAEKEHLRKLKKLKEAARALERQKKIAGAVTEMTSSMQEKFDENKEMVERLGMAAAHSEARMEVAMDSTEDRAREINLEAEDEEALRKARARELIRKMQTEAAADKDPRNVVPGPDRKSAVSPDEKTPSVSPSANSAGSGKKVDSDLPEKTIGRMKP